MVLTCLSLLSQEINRHTDRSMICLLSQITLDNYQQGTTQQWHRTVANGINSMIIKY